MGRWRVRTWKRRHAFDAWNGDGIAGGHPWRPGSARFTATLALARSRPYSMKPMTRLFPTSSGHFHAPPSLATPGLACATPGGKFR